MSFSIRREEEPFSLIGSGFRPSAADSMSSALHEDQQNDIPIELQEPSRDVQYQNLLGLTTADPYESSLAQANRDLREELPFSLGDDVPIELQEPGRDLQYQNLLGLTTDDHYLSGLDPQEERPPPWQDTGGLLQDPEEISGVGGDWSEVDREILQHPDGRYQVKVTFRFPDGSEKTYTQEDTDMQRAINAARREGFGAAARYKRDQRGRGNMNNAYGGIVGLAEGGHVPLYAYGGVPGYGIGGFLKGLGKFALKAAPLALGFIPGVSGLSGLAKAGIGAALKGGSDLAEGRGLNVESMLGGAGRAQAAGSAADRMRNIEGLEGQGLWGSIGKMGCISNSKLRVSPAPN